MTKYVELRAKTYSYLTDDGSEDKKDTNKCIIKTKLKFENYKICLEATELDKKKSPKKTKINRGSFKRNHKKFN